MEENKELTYMEEETTEEKTPETKEDNGNLALGAGLILVAGVAIVAAGIKAVQAIKNRKKPEAEEDSDEEEPKKKFKKKFKFFKKKSKTQENVEDTEE